MRYDTPPQIKDLLGELHLLEYDAEIQLDELGHIDEALRNEMARVQDELDNYRIYGILPQ